MALTPTNASAEISAGKRSVKKMWTVRSPVLKSLWFIWHNEGKLKTLHDCPHFLQEPTENIRQAFQQSTKDMPCV